VSEAPSQRPPPQGDVFTERLTGPCAPDVLTTALPLLIAAVLAAWLGWPLLAAAVGALGLFVAFFFRNPSRHGPPDPEAVWAPADGRVIEVGETETPDGRKALRIGIFLSIFDVHVNRAPVAGRVRRLDRGGQRYLAAFNPDAATHNVQLAMELELADGRRVDVVQITGLIARRIVCQPRVGDWLERGVRYGLIRFGSRTDVWLPSGSEARVARGDRVRGGQTVLARLPAPEGSR